MSEASVAGSARVEAGAYPSAATAWTFVTFLAFASIVSFLDRQVLNLLVDPIRGDLGITDTQFSLLQGIAFTLFYAVAGLALGAIVDRGNRRNVVAIGVTAWSLATVYCGYADSFAELAIGRVGVAVGEGCLLPASYSLLSDLFDPSRRGRAAGVLSVGMALGNGLSMVIGGALLTALAGVDLTSLPSMLPHAQWQLVFVIVGLSGLPVALLMLSLREPRRLGVAAKAPGVPLSALGRFIRENWAAVGALFGAPSIMMISTSAMLAWGATLLIRDFGLSRADAGFGMGIALVVGGAVGPLLMGWLSDRNVARGIPAARLRLFTPATPVMVVGVALIAFAKTPTTALIGMCIVTLCAVGFATMLFTGIQDICPNQLRGRMVAASTICTNVIGIALGPTLLAFAREHLLPEGTSLALAYGIVSAPIIAVGVTVAVAGYGPFARAEERLRGAAR